MSAIHPTAIIDSSAELGEVAIGPYAVIEANAVVGTGTTIGAHSVVKRYTRIGRDNRIAEHVVIGGDPQDLKFTDCASFVELGNGNIVREGVTIHRGSAPESPTRIGDGCFLMATAHVAHDCTVGNRVVIANGAMLGGVVSIGDAAFVSGNVVVHQFCRIGRLAMAAGGARVIQDCLPFMISEGAPARARVLNIVGLRRAGVPAEEIAALKRALHALRTAGSLAAALDRLAADNSAAVAELAEFIRSATRGFAHPRG
ncbi:MAG TPA: acyl-ACP--UDP-N-acetylglucosamine O-acyltransferase [Burkholderiales bacterium]|nr:acyl-ACP--UDP-N-acetylglucosamine O-acyltransferase [Burkholderiales bacterium]